jgi:hypothetical protein
LRKLALNVLRLIDVGKKDVGIAKKRNIIGWNLPKYFEHSQKEPPLNRCIKKILDCCVASPSLSVYV